MFQVAENRPHNSNYPQAGFRRFVDRKLVILNGSSSPEVTGKPALRVVAKRCVGSLRPWLKGIRTLDGEALFRMA